MNSRVIISVQRAVAVRERKPRLLVVGPLPPPIGGVETVTKAVLESGAFAGFDVLHCDTTKDRPRYTHGRFDLPNVIWGLRHWRQLRRGIRSFRPDAVYLPLSGTWSGFIRDALFARVAKMSGAKVVAHVHGSRIDDRLRARGLAGAFVRRSLEKFDTILVLGTAGLRLFEAYGVKSRLAVVPSTLARETFERGVSSSRNVESLGVAQALFVGQVGERKGVFDLLHAVKRVKDAGVRLRLTVVGPEEWEGELDRARSLAKQLGIEDVVRFTGTLTGDALHDEFGRADFLVLPSYKERLPVVIFEAGAFGIPVIVTGVGNITDVVVHEENGLLVEPGNVDQIAQAVTRMATDHEGRAGMGARLREDIRRFHPDMVCARIAEEIEKTLCAQEPGSSARRDSDCDLAAG